MMPGSTYSGECVCITGIADGNTLLKEEMACDISEGFDLENMNTLVRFDVVSRSVGQSVRDLSDF